MEYALFVLPHANARYAASSSKLFLAEVQCIALAAGLAMEDVHVQQEKGLSFVGFHAPEMTAAQRGALRRSALSYGLFSRRAGDFHLEEGPFSSPFSAMAAILKYKGKTNETFTSFLLNMAIFSSVGAPRFEGGLRVLDPMCGRGTSLFVALAHGHDAFGIEIDPKNVQEMHNFTKRYLTYEHFKHKEDVQGLTVGGKKGGEKTTFVLSADAEAYKAGHVQKLCFVHGDAVHAKAFYSKEAFDVLVCDLPYGVQHAPRQGNQGGKARITLEQMLHRMLEPACALLKAGGAAALSFNTFTLKRAVVCAALEDAGCRVLTAPYYQDLSHWVEQAVERDCVVAVKDHG